MKPLCDVCGERHESYQAHVFARAAAVVEKPASAVKPEVKPSTTVVKPAQWRERDPEAYRVYMRGYMAKRRAAGKVAA